MVSKEFLLSLTYFSSFKACLGKDMALTLPTITAVIFFNKQHTLFLNICFRRCSLVWMDWKPGAIITSLLTWCWLILAIGSSRIENRSPTDKLNSYNQVSRIILQATWKHPPSMHAYQCVDRDAAYFNFTIWIDVACRDKHLLFASDISGTLNRPATRKEINI